MPPDWWEEWWDHALDWLPGIPLELYKECIADWPNGKLDYQTCLCMKMQLWAEKEGLA